MTASSSPRRPEQPTVNFGVQGLHAPVHDLGKSRVARDFPHREALACQQLRGTAGREDFDVACAQPARELDETGLVGNGQQRAADGQNMGRVDLAAQRQGRTA